MFETAQEIAANRMLCYVDADILLLRDGGSESWPSRTRPVGIS